MLVKAVKRHTACKWALLYINRWLTVPYQTENGTTVDRNKGVPQGSVVGPLLSNLFLHYAFDEWMKRNYPGVPFERYADDVICHCKTKGQTESLKKAIQQRLAACMLELNESKSKIVYCKDSNRKECFENIQFDFLGYTFRPRSVRSKSGDFFTGFNPAISNKAKKRIGSVMREWIPKRWIHLNLEEIAKMINPVIQGWINYYGKFYPSGLRDLLQGIDAHLSYWVRRKFRRFRHRKTQSIYWLGNIARSNPKLFAHWNWGVRPTASE